MWIADTMWRERGRLDPRRINPRRIDFDSEGERALVANAV